MALFDRGKDKKAAEEAKKVAESATRSAQISKAQAKLALDKVGQEAARADKAEKELKAMQAAKRREEMFSKAKAKPVTGVPGAPRAAAGVSGMAVKPAAGPAIIGTYTVKKGDTLGAIAKQYYGVTGPKYWNLIQAANKDLIKDVNMISVGQVFKIPALPEELKKK